MMAAEKMKVAVSRVLNREMRRGWDAWVLEVRSQNRIAATTSVNRFIRLRVVAFLLRR